jgi:hypothetical protein
MATRCYGFTLFKRDARWNKTGTFRVTFLTMLDNVASRRDLHLDVCQG